MKKIVLLYFAWFAALASLVGSLFFSEVMKLQPCVLCWYQRIFMYPLAVVLLVGILRRDRNSFWYSIPLSVGGVLVALYHYLLYIHIIPESAGPCSFGVSCTLAQVTYFGFINIPLMSLASFAFITACLLIFKRNNNEI